MTSVLFDSQDGSGNVGGYGNANANLDSLSYYPSGGYDASQYTQGARVEEGSRSATHHPVGGRMFAMNSAFGDGGFADEPPLLEELGVNFDHMKTKASQLA